MIIFGSVRFLSKKVTKPKFFFFEKKNRNRTETGSNRPVSVRFFRAKTGLTRFFRFWLGFLGFGSVFSGFGSVFFGLDRFFRFGSVFFRVFCRFWFGSVQFFWFFVYKTEPAGFFKKLIGLIGFFFRLIFFRFSRFNRFSGFFAHPYLGALLPIW